MFFLELTGSNADAMLVLWTMPWWRRRTSWERRWHIFQDWGKAAKKAWCWTKAYYVQAWQLTQPKRCGESELLARAERLLQIRVQLQFKVQQDILCWERSLINVYLETKWKTWCIWRLRLAGVRILQMLNNKTSAYPPTWHLGCGLGTCPTCWVWRAGCPGE